MLGCDIVRTAFVQEQGLSRDLEKGSHNRGLKTI